MVVVYGVLLVLGVVLLVVAMLRVSLGGVTGGRARGRGSEGMGARGVLEERHAAGELSAQEYEHCLGVIERDGS